MAEEKKKVNVKEDGTPIAFGEEGYLIAGKYKTVEEAEKGIKEGEQKITELGQGKAESDKARGTLQEIISKAGKEKEGKVVDEKEKVRKTRVDGLKKAWAEGPESALSFIDKLVDEGISAKGLLKREDYEKGVSGDRELMTAFNKVRGTGDRRKEFDILKPDMGKLWSALPEEARTPEMVENVFFMARGKANPEDLKAKIIEELKSGVSQKGGSRGDEDKRSEDDKKLEGILEANVEKKIF